VTPERAERNRAPRSRALASEFLRSCPVAISQSGMANGYQDHMDFVGGDYLVRFETRTFAAMRLLRQQYDLALEE
jgi:hypothetical protein